MQAILFTTATISQGTILTVRIKVSKKLQQTETLSGLPGHIRSCWWCWPQMQREGSWRKGTYLSVSPPVRTHVEKKVPFCNWRPGPISTSFKVWQIRIGLPKNTVQASSREVWREVWTLHLFGRRYPGRKRKIEDSSTSNIKEAIQIVIWHTQLT